MKTVWKYSLKTAETMIELPAGAKILKFDAQGRAMAIWALVDTDAPKELRHFYVLATGDALPFEFNTHRGTCLVERGTFVWHLFENTVGNASPE